MIFINTFYSDKSNMFVNFANSLIWNTLLCVHHSLLCSYNNNAVTRFRKRSFLNLRLLLYWKTIFISGSCCIIQDLECEPAIDTNIVYYIIIDIVLNVYGGTDVVKKIYFLIPGWSGNSPRHNFSLLREHLEKFGIKLRSLNIWKLVVNLLNFDQRNPLRSMRTRSKKILTV